MLASGLPAKAVLANGLHGMRGGITFVFAASLGLVVVSTIALGYNLYRVRDRFAWVEHTNEVLRDIGAAERSLLEAESGERGYLLTGDAVYRDAYEAGRAELSRTLAVLQQHVADNTEQMRRLDDLRPIVDARLEQFRRGMEIGPGHQDEVLAFLRGAQAEHMTPRIIERFARIRQAELSLLADRQDAAGRGLVFATLLAAATSILALVGAAIGAWQLERRRGADRLMTAGEELARSQFALKSRDADLQAVLGTVPDAMIIIDERGSIQSFSTAAERLFGFSAEEIRGRNINILMPEPYHSEHDGYLDRYRTTREPHIIGKVRVVMGKRKDGATFPMELYVGEVQIAGYHRFVGFVRDMSERAENERKVRELQSELLHVSRLSSMGEMASALAHELNQPLAAVANYLQGTMRLLQNNADERVARARDAVGRASEQVLRAGAIIRRLRDFVSRGQTDHQVESVSQLIEEAVALAANVANQQAVRMTMRFDAEADLVVADRIQIQQVLLNLIRNAIEAMNDAPRRELVLSAEQDGPGMVAVAVADTGSGIPPEIADRLFQPFTTTKKEGMGVGLSLSRTIIESHGGRISVHANPEGGTIFRFTLRLAETD